MISGELRTLILKIICTYLILLKRKQQDTPVVIISLHANHADSRVLNLCILLACIWSVVVALLIIYWQSSWHPHNNNTLR